MPPDDLTSFAMPPYFHDPSIMSRLDLALVHAVFIKRGAGRISHGLGYPSRRRPAWRLAFDAIDEKYATKGTMSRVLPAGTKVYRGNLDAHDPLSHRQGATVLYFGLDAIISIWAAFESFKWQQKNRPSKTDKWHGYLHELTLTQPMRYRYIHVAGGVPTDTQPACTGAPCIHPQSILHDPDWVLLQELGTELTMPLSAPRELSKLRHDRVHTVDFAQMMMHQTECMSQWNPLNAVIRSHAPLAIATLGRRRTAGATP